MISLADYPWQDVRRVALPTADEYRAEALLRAFLQAPAPWVHRLMHWRDRLVAPLGLKVAATPLPQAGQSLVAGERYGIFRVIAASRDAVLLGEDDRHLDFRLLLRWLPGELQVITAVRPRNFGGRLYLALVTPFHHLIVAHSLPRMRARLLAPAA